MAPPSSLPSAAKIAEGVREKYISHFGKSADEFPEELDQQAECFFDNNQLKNYFIRSLIDHHAFAANPNHGHIAIADLILTQATEAVVSTNVDTLIEQAANGIFGKAQAVLDGTEAATVPHNLSPLLKIHGCWSKEPETTIWTKRQLEVEPNRSRIRKSTTWLEQLLPDKDLLIVGFWTDWMYLNSVLESALGAALPSQVIVFDLSPIDQLASKAPGICALSDSDAPARRVRLLGREA